MRIVSSDDDVGRNEVDVEREFLELGEPAFWLGDGKESFVDLTPGDDADDDTFVSQLAYGSIASLLPLRKLIIQSASRRYIIRGRGRWLGPRGEP